jgi:aminopeptidase N
VEAMRRLTDIERIRLIEDPSAEVGREWLDIVRGLLRGAPLPSGLRAYLLRIEEQSLDRRFVPAYRERYEARRRLMRAVTDHLMDELLAAYESVNTYAPAAEPRGGIEERRLKAVLLRVLAEADTPRTHALISDHFRRAWNITDKASALVCAGVGSHPGLRELMREAYAAWHASVAGYSTYLAAVGGGTHGAVFDMIAEEERRPTFHIEHPNHSRGLYLPVASNNKLLWTERGIGWMAETVIRMAPVNENTANRLVAAFQNVHSLAADLQPRVLAALEAMRSAIDPAVAPSTHGRVQAYIRGT